MADRELRNPQSRAIIADTLARASRALGPTPDGQPDPLRELVAIARAIDAMEPRHRSEVKYMLDLGVLERLRNVLPSFDALDC